MIQTVCLLSILMLLLQPYTLLFEDWMSRSVRMFEDKSFVYTEPECGGYAFIEQCAPNLYATMWFAMLNNELESSTITEQEKEMVIQWVYSLQHNNGAFSYTEHQKGGLQPTYLAVRLFDLWDIDPPPPIRLNINKYLETLQTHEGLYSASPGKEADCVATYLVLSIKNILGLSVDGRIYDIVLDRINAELNNLDPTPQNFGSYILPLVQSLLLIDSEREFSPIQQKCRTFAESSLQESTSIGDAQAVIFLENQMKAREVLSAKIPINAKYFNAVMNLLRTTDGAFSVSGSVNIMDPQITYKLMKIGKDVRQENILDQTTIESIVKRYFAGQGWYLPAIRDADPEVTYYALKSLTCLETSCQHANQVKRQIQLWMNNSAIPLSSLRTHYHIIECALLMNVPIPAHYHTRLITAVRNEDIGSSTDGSKLPLVSTEFWRTRIAQRLGVNYQCPEDYFSSLLLEQVDLETLYLVCSILSYSNETVLIEKKHEILKMLNKAKSQNGGFKANGRAVYPDIYSTWQALQIFRMLGESIPQQDTVRTVTPYLIAGGGASVYPTHASSHFGSAACLPDIRATWCVFSILSQP